MNHFFLKSCLIFFFIISQGNEAFTFQKKKCSRQFRKPEIIPSVDLFLHELSVLKKEYFTLAEYKRLVKNGARPKNKRYIFPKNPGDFYKDQLRVRGETWSWEKLHPHGNLRKQFMSLDRFLDEITKLQLSSEGYRKAYKLKTLPSYSDVTFPSDPSKQYRAALKASGRNYIWAKEGPNPLYVPDVTSFIEELRHLKSEYFTLDEYLKFIEAGARPRDQRYIFPKKPDVFYRDELLAQGQTWNWQRLHPHAHLKKKFMSLDRFLSEIAQLELSSSAYRQAYKSNDLPVYDDVIFPSTPSSFYKKELELTGRKLHWSKKDPSLRYLEARPKYLPDIASFIEELRYLKEGYYTFREYTDLIEAGARPRDENYVFPNVPNQIYREELLARGEKWSWESIHPHRDKKKTLMPPERFIQEILDLGMTVSVYEANHKLGTLPVYPDVYFPARPRVAYKNYRGSLGEKFLWPKIGSLQKRNATSPHLSKRVYLPFPEARKHLTSPEYKALTRGEKERIPIPLNPEEYYGVTYDELYSLSLFSLEEFRYFLKEKSIFDQSQYMAFYSPESYSGVLPQNPVIVYGMTWDDIIDGID